MYIYEHKQQHIMIPIVAPIMITILTTKPTMIPISVSQDDETDYTSTALYKSHSFDTALDTEFHQRLAEGNISLQTSLYKHHQ